MDYTINGMLVEVTDEEQKARLAAYAEKLTGQKRE